MITLDQDGVHSEDPGGHKKEIHSGGMHSQPRPGTPPRSPERRELQVSYYTAIMDRDSRQWGTELDI